LSMARGAWLKVTCRIRNSVSRILLYLTDFWDGICNITPFKRLSR
jgi:hypothetical protein